jgi:hypothetical protein
MEDWADARKEFETSPEVFLKTKPFALPVK